MPGPCSREPLLALLWPQLPYIGGYHKWATGATSTQNGIEPIGPIAEIRITVFPSRLPTLGFAILLASADMTERYAWLLRP